MVEQAQEERQVLRVHAFFIEREKVLPVRRGEQIVGVLDALGDALQRIGLADVVLREKGFELGVADLCIDRRQATS